ncbi:hypothetical protein ACFO1B_56620 [Dactylosporangium siamense]|uniref:Uncharacterized protein n=1 Tax=Dactylosporangium siamense TaxID=685454 RepID=A0A919PZU3_9ACTN|nr:hypothetical protein [Dactylosporangium siamense]GIG53099.1 hypothetical protein Dsi01nite_111400 [Dactylosporangium siamense]
MIPVFVGVAGALAGTVIGALLTQLLQRRNTASAKVHDARLDAYRTFAAVTMNYRSALMDRWLLEHEGRAGAEAEHVYTLRSEVWAAYFQVVLVAGDREIAARAERAREATHAIKRATSRHELEASDVASREAVGRFADLARHEVSAVRGVRGNSRP